MDKDNILLKSEKNLEAAKHLINSTTCFCSSVHCSYYSAFQYIKYFLCNVHNISYQDQELLYSIYRNEDKDNKMGSHEFLIYKCFQYIKENDEAKSNVFNTNIISLKNQRHKSDYKDKLINENNAKDSLAKAKAIKELIENL